MSFEKFETTFSDVEAVGCRDLLWGQKLILDLFEYLENGPAEEMKVAGEEVQNVYTIGLTRSSRIWRVTFERSLAVRIRDESIKFFESQNGPKPELPSRFCFTDRSPWLSELFPNPTDPRLGSVTPIHYVFDLLDDFVEIIADDNPTIENIENDMV
jgi:hypothetical protein